MKKWLVIADSAQAEIYSISIPYVHQNSMQAVEQNDKYHPPVNLVEKLSHSESKLKDSELMTDKPGGHVSQRGSFHIYDPSSDPNEEEKKSFAKTLADYLKHQNDLNCFDELILCMEPSFEGKLKQKLDKNLQRNVTKEIQKHITNLPENKKMQAISKICEEV